MMALLLSHAPSDVMPAVVGYLANNLADKTDDEVIEALSVLADEVGMAIIKIRQVRSRKVILPGEVAH
jgi:hypothetical protein